MNVSDEPILYWYYLWKRVCGGLRGLGVSKEEREHWQWINYQYQSQKNGTTPLPQNGANIAE
ncbi:MAG: hypothetical protein LBJ67_17480 [Planctomycetaceae bacterium]|jgi:hypothetical protein|nr:hypothetical protein [Planctomycetaceae bacterium]